MALPSAAVAAMAAALTGLLGQSVIVRRGAASGILTAVPTHTTVTVDNGDGSLTTVESQDFLIETANYDLGSGPVLPAPDDTIERTINGSLVVFRVCPIGGEPCFRYVDPGRTLLRIHTKEDSSV